MPHLVSLDGLWTTRKYVHNWYSIVAVYAGVLSKTIARFKDGEEVSVSKQNYIAFREAIYKRYLTDKGYRYHIHDNSTIIRTKDGSQIILLPNCSNVIDEVYERNCYNIQDLTGRNVIDIGPFFGESSIYFINRGASKVYSLESNQEFYELAKKNIELNGLSDRIHLYHKKADPISLRTLILETRLENVLLKIDCEGCEYELLANLDAEVFMNVSEVVMEYHRQPEFLVQRLRKLGFKVQCKKSIFTGPEGMIFAKKIENS